MLFTRDENNPGSFWVDQDRHYEVDHFQPCDYCRQLIENPPLEQHEWRWWSLCDPCQTDLEISTAIDKARSMEQLDLEDRLMASMMADRLVQQLNDWNTPNAIPPFSPGDLPDIY